MSEATLVSDVSLGSIFVDACLINNFVLAYFLGICPFLGVSGKLATATRMGGAVTFVILIASVCAHGINALLLAIDAEYLRLISFIVVIASTVQLVEMFVKKVSPTLFRALGIFLPLITTNCAILGLALSGGGSRAAVFGAAAIEALWEHGLLGQISHVSSVSGGSMASSYFVANKPDCDGAQSEAEKETCWREFFSEFKKAMRYRYRDVMEVRQIVKPNRALRAVVVRHRLAFLGDGRRGQVLQAEIDAHLGESPIEVQAGGEAEAAVDLAALRFSAKSRNRATWCASIASAGTVGLIAAILLGLGGFAMFRLAAWGVFLHGPLLLIGSAVVWWPVRKVLSVTCGVVALSIVALPVIIIVDARTDTSLMPLTIAIIVNAMVWFSIALHARARLEHIESIWHHTSVARWFVKRQRRGARRSRTPRPPTPNTPHGRT